MQRRLTLLLALALALPLAVAAADPGEAPTTDGTATEAAKLGVEALRALGTSGRVEAIATYPGRTPTAQDVQRLTSLGIEVQPMRNLPLALVRGPVSALRAAVDRGYAFDVYPNEELEYHDLESSGAIGADSVWEDLGYDGSGVGVAVIDSGVDATHPDLEDRVTHNIKIVGSEYADSYNNAFSFVIPVDEGPYNNSDLGSGHGTHVAGIVAADGSGDPELLGVAPGAEIIGYGSGDVALIFTIIASFEHVLEHHEEWNIRVTNNSWGSSFRHFDPMHPIHLATKALYDVGIVTVFSAGNSAQEMQLNPWSMAPWVISAGSATIDAERSGFSSGGLQYDNSLPVELPGDGHIRFTGDRIGVYNPDVSAPGSSIRSAGTPTGLYVGPTPPGGSTTASGTSMSAPHIAGLVALLLEANPDLTPDQVKQALQVTARPMADGSHFWQSGYGFVDAPAAIELVTSDEVRADPDGVLGALQEEADRAVLDAREHRVTVTDHFWFEALPATVGGLDTRTFTFEVEEGTDAIRGSAAFAATLSLLGLNEFVWELVLRDAADEVVAVSQTSGAQGYSHYEVDLDGLDDEPTFGEWTLEVVGLLAVADEVRWYSSRISVAVAQLVRQTIPDFDVALRPDTFAKYTPYAVGFFSTHFRSGDGGFYIFDIVDASGDPIDDAEVELIMIDRNGEEALREEATQRGDGAYQVADIYFDMSWDGAPGPYRVTFEPLEDLGDVVVSDGQFFLNHLAISTEELDTEVEPGDSVTVDGTVQRVTDIAADPVELDLLAGGDVTARLLDTDRNVLDEATTSTTSDFELTLTVPESATSLLGIELVATYDDPEHLLLGPTEWYGQDLLALTLAGADADDEPAPAPAPDPADAAPPHLPATGASALTLAGLALALLASRLRWRPRSR